MCFKKFSCKKLIVLTTALDKQFGAPELHTLHTG
jgi:hypothetical protein